jgi:hypothetical protein
MWREVIEGHSHLWKGVPMDRKELIRGAAVSFKVEDGHEITLHQGSSFISRMKY